MPAVQGAASAQWLSQPQSAEKNNSKKQFC